MRQHALRMECLLRDFNTVASDDGLTADFAFACEGQGVAEP